MMVTVTPHICIEHANAMLSSPHVWNDFLSGELVQNGSAEVGAQAS
jgi:hypothetical protein